MLRPPQVLRATITQGNAVAFYITVGQGATCQYDLTGASVWFTVKRSPLDPDGQALIQKIYPSNLSIPDKESGLIRIYLGSEDTINLPPWYYEYAFDLQIKDAQDNIVTAFQGTLAVYPSYTKSKS